MQRRKRVFREDSESDTEQHDDIVKPSPPTQPIPKSKEEVIEIIEIIDLDDDTDTSGFTRAPDSSLKLKEYPKILINLGGKRVKSENQQRDRRCTPSRLFARLFARQFCLLNNFYIRINSCIST
jgi:hypothetical protein